MGIKPIKIRDFKKFLKNTNLNGDLVANKADEKLLKRIINSLNLNKDKYLDEKDFTKIISLSYNSQLISGLQAPTAKQELLPRVDNKFLETSMGLELLQQYFFARKDNEGAEQIKQLKKNNSINLINNFIQYSNSNFPKISESNLTKIDFSQMQYAIAMNNNIHPHFKEGLQAALKYLTLNNIRAADFSNQEQEQISKSFIKAIDNEDYDFHLLGEMHNKSSGPKMLFKILKSTKNIKHLALERDSQFQNDLNELIHKFQGKDFNSTKVFQKFYKECLHLFTTLPNNQPSSSPLPDILNYTLEESATERTQAFVFCIAECIKKNIEIHCIDSLDSSKFRDQVFFDKSQHLEGKVLGFFGGFHATKEPQNIQSESIVTKGRINPEKPYGLLLENAGKKVFSPLGIKNGNLIFNKQ